MHIVKIAVYYFGLVTLLSLLVGHFDVTFSSRDKFPKEEECSIGACQAQESQENEKKTEIERKTLQSLHIIRAPKSLYPDVSVSFINKIS